MRRALAVVLLVVVACTPGLTAGRKGFTAARAPSYGQITIATQPAYGPANGGAGFWNVAAGRPLFKVSASPVIKFQAQTPILTPVGRRAAHVEQTRNADGSMRSCVVYYDPALPTALNARLFAHEIGHCLELDGHQACGQDDRVMDCVNVPGYAGRGPTPADTAQLRAARYIR